MSKKISDLLHNVGILTISNIASKLLVFFLVPLYTSVLSTSDYGLYDLVITTINIVYPVLTINISDAILRFMLDRKYDKNSVMTVAFKYFIISVTIVSITFSIQAIFDIYTIIHGFEIYIWLYYVVYALNDILIQYAKGKEKIKEIGVTSVLSTLVIIISNIIFLLVLKTGIKGFLISNILGLLVSAAFYIIKLDVVSLLHVLKKNCTLEKEMLRYSAPLISTVLCWWINGAFDRYVVTLFRGISDNGLLSIAYKIPTILNTVQGIFIQAWQISAIKEKDQNAERFYGQVFVYVNFVITMVCSFLIMFTRPLSRLLFSKDFFTAWVFVPFLLLSSVFNSASGLLGPILAVKKDSKTMALSAIYGTVINVVLNILLVYLIGIQGATIATVISSLVIYCVRRRAVINDCYILNYKNVVITWILIVMQAIEEVYFPVWQIQILNVALIVIINKNICNSLPKYIKIHKQ